jgi:cation diffusion facilitator family transporter
MENGELRMENEIDARKRYGMRSGVYGICVNAALAVSKFVVGTAANSVAITADAFNNLSDCLTSLLTILGFRWAAAPADEQHPFGHSRVEYLTGLAVAGIIFIAGYEVMRSSISRIISPELVEFSWLAFAIVTVSILAKIWMWLYNRHLGRKINSETLAAVGTDSRNDVLITSATLVALVFSRFSDLPIDGYIGAAIALVFFKSGWDAGSEAVDRIIGRPTDPKTGESISQIVTAYPEILEAHDLVVHCYGPGRSMASLHVSVSADMTLGAAHEVADKAEKEVQEKLGIQLVIHVDPAQDEDK